MEARLEPGKIALQPGARVIVTGGTGHIGSHLVRALDEAGASVLLLVPPGSTRAGGRRAVEVDLGRRDEVRRVFEAERPELCFHLGWGGVRRTQLNDPLQIVENVPATLHVVDAACRVGVRAIVALGSQEEYGATTGVIDESSPTSPVHAYGSAKLAAGRLALELARLHGTRLAWVRLFISYGPGEDASRLIPTVTSALLEGRSPAVSAGHQQRDYLYVTDVADALLSVAASAGAEGVMNLGSGEAHSIRSIIEMLRELIDPTAVINYGSVSLQPRDVALLQADCARLHALTGWSPRVSLREGLTRTVAWHRARR